MSMSQLAECKLQGRYASAISSLNCGLNYVGTNRLLPEFLPKLIKCSYITKHTILI